MFRPFPKDFSLLLASQSPRRRHILEGIGVPFTVVLTDAEEILEGDDPADLAERNARAKVEAARLPDRARGAFVLGTDTIVVVDGEALGKPADRAEAKDMLRRLSGREHEVVSGVALRRMDDETVSGYARTAVRFVAITPERLGAYLDSGEWEGKAGAYAIQGLAGLLISGIDGEYLNVVGLPVHLLSELFERHGLDLLAGRWMDEGRSCRSSAKPV